MQDMIGKMLDKRYELLELIGTGGMADVYKAKCHRLNRLVAVKVLKRELAKDAEFRRRFRDESLAVAQLSHANIVAIYDVSTSEEGMEYIVMELIDGITLKQYMERRGQMDWREALHFIVQIMHGLSHAHSRGIVHRDIKPQNIMVLRDGSVKVADFGIACAEGSHDEGEALGSVHYISPEQARGDRIDERSDVYSAGVVLYEMLTGRLPFEGDNAVTVAIQHLSSTPLTPRDINPNIPEPLEIICLKAMQPELNRRYMSAAAMAEDLERFRKDPTIDMTSVKVSMEVAQDKEPTMPLAKEKVQKAVKHQQKKQQPRSPWENMIPKDKKQRNLFFGGIAAAIVIIVVLFAAIFGSFGGPDNGGTYTVPKVLGMTPEEANALEEVAGVFNIVVVGKRANDDYQPGQIISQEPAEGVQRKDNLDIEVFVCAEAEVVKMPALVGSNYQNARILLQHLDLNLKITKEEQFSNEYGIGEVITTFPEAKVELQKDQSVTLFVSKGHPKVTVPSFMEKDVAAAIRDAERLGLQVGPIEYEYSGYYDSGTVIRQSIPVADEVAGGTEIIFTVCGDFRDATAQFSVPESLAGKTSVKVEFFLNDQQVATDYLSKPNPVDPILYEFSGESGTVGRVYATFDGIKTEEQEIAF